MSLKDILDIDELIAREMTNLSSYSSEPGLAELSVQEQEAILTRLGDIACNDDVFGVLWSVREAIFDVVRAVKASIRNSECIFKGEDAEGKQLDMMILMPEDIVRNGTAITSFLQNVTAGTAYYLSGENDSNIQTPDWEGVVYAGWYDPVESPKLEKVKYNLPTGARIIETPFGLMDEVPLVRHKAIKITPETYYSIEVRYGADGLDAARPVGVKILPAERKTL